MFFRISLNFKTTGTLSETYVCSFLNIQRNQKMKLKFLALPLFSLSAISAQAAPADPYSLAVGANMNNAGVGVSIDAAKAFKQFDWGNLSGGLTGGTIDANTRYAGLFTQADRSINDFAKIYGQVGVAQTWGSKTVTSASGTSSQMGSTSVPLIGSTQNSTSSDHRLTPFVGVGLDYSLASLSPSLQPVSMFVQGRYYTSVATGDSSKDRLVGTIGLKTSF
ncbi:hypothetical protein M2125_001019 [Polynucleobacter sphagniphilus]|uniref:hypothetical protein n=1 Tax=Polynucleobacter sphagniphilus TaxID=1743169 RepID=UPI0024757104|nr:hypothetical protein [Polynucleobacter sphagniphilus]MDH6241212.1 hypothetical protein [Polynucleobacter sphagniphilus]